jgi:HTH-type transcriptional regulator / antitoxin HipB
MHDIAELMTGASGPVLYCCLMHDRADSDGSVNPAWALAVHRRRRDLGLRQDELAALAGVSTRTVHAIEAGKLTVRMDMLTAVLETLGLTFDVSGPAPRTP